MNSYTSVVLARRSDCCNLQQSQTKTKTKYRKSWQTEKLLERYSVGAAVAAVFIRAVWRFHVKRKAKNSTEGFPGRKKVFLTDLELS